MSVILRDKYGKMLTKAQGWQRLSDIITDNYTHPDYKYTVELSEKYKILITGHDADKLLHQFSPREDKDLFDQRVNLTQLITPAVCGMIMRPAWKINGVIPLVSDISYSPKNDAAKNQLTQSVNDFYGGIGVDGYITEKFLPLDYIDPNAWIIEKFSDFDNRFENPKVYCTEVTAADVADFLFLNNELQQLTVRKFIDYTLATPIRGTNADGKRVKMETKTGRFYQIYLHNDEIQAEQVDAKVLVGNVKYGTLFEAEESAGKVYFTGYIPAEETKGGVSYYMLSESKELFRVKFFEPKTGYVPAMRVGHIADAVTMGRTCVNPFHTAVPYLMKTVQTISELDLSQRLHVFPQKFQYYPPCPGYTDQDGQHTACNSGTTVDGNTCKNCNGSGVLVHKTAADVVGLAMPTNPSEMIDLTKLVHYANLPIDTVKWLDEYLHKNIEGAVRAAFNSDMFVTQTSVATATQKSIELDSVYDAIKPIANKWAQLRVFIVKTNAVYLSINSGLTVAYKFPSNFKMETQGQIIEKIKAAKDANASEYVIGEYNRQLMESVLQDQPDKIKKAEVQERYNPFTGKTDDIIQSFIGSGNVRERDEVFYINRTGIFKGIEAEYPEFYDLTEEKQNKIVNEAIDTLMIEIKASKLAEQSVLMNPFGQANSGGAVTADELGKLPLALQQLGLAASRADELGDTSLSNMIRAKMKQLTKDI